MVVLLACGLAMGRVAAGVALLLCSFLDLGLSQYEGVTPECVPTDTYVSAKPESCGRGASLCARGPTLVLC